MVRPTSKLAVQWCALGALQAESPTDYCLRYTAYQELLSAMTERIRVDEFNDCQVSPEPVLALYDRAIAALESP
jgi:hypothetical protein